MALAASSARASLRPIVELVLLALVVAAVAGLALPTSVVAQSTGRDGATSASLHPSISALSGSARVASHEAAAAGATPAGLPIGIAAGQVAQTVAPWANYSQPGYHKISGEPSDFGPGVYDPRTGDLWIAETSPFYYNVPDPIAVVNATTMATVGLITVAPNAAGMAFDPTNGIMYVAEGEGTTIARLNAETGKLAGPAIPVGPTPGALAFNPVDSMLYVADVYNGTVIAISTLTNTVVKWSAYLGIDPGGLLYDGLAYAAHGNNVAVTIAGSNYVDWLNGSTLYNRTGFSAGGAYPSYATSLVVDQNGYAYVTSGDYGPYALRVANLTTVINTIALPAYASYTVFDPSTLEVLVADWSTHTLIVVNTTTQAETGTLSTSPDYIPEYMVYVPDRPFLDVLDDQVLYNQYGGSTSAPYPFGDTAFTVSVTTGATLSTSNRLAGAPTQLAYDPSTGNVVVADGWSQNLTFIAADDPAHLPDLTQYVNGSPGTPAYDPLTHTLWIPMEITTWSVTSAFWESDNVVLTLNDTTFAVTNVLDPLPSVPYTAMDWATYDPVSQTMLLVATNTNTLDSYVIALNARTDAPVGSPLNLGWSGYGAFPYAVLVPESNQLFVTNPIDEEVWAVNATALTLRATITVGDEPDGIAYDSADNNLYVANTGDWNMTLINATADRVTIPAVDLDGAPLYVAYDPDTELVYVGVERDGGPTPSNLETTLVVLDGSTPQAVWGPWPTIYTGYSAPSPPSSAIFVPSNVPGTPGTIWNTNTFDGSITVISIPPMVTSFFGAPDDLEVGQPLVLTATAAGGTDGLTPSYAGLPPGCTSAPTWTIDCTPTAGGTFVVNLTVTDGIGLSTWALVTLTIAPAVTLPGTLTPGLVDVGQTVWGNVTPSNGVAPYAVVWSFGDGGAGTGDDVTHSFATPGLYTVRANVTDALGLLGVFTGSVEVNALPTLTISSSLTSSSTTVGQSIDFGAVVAGGTLPISAIAWTFGDGGTATGAFVSHTYLAAGSVTVTATATDARGLVATASLVLTVTSVPAPGVTLTLGATTVIPGTPVSFVAEVSGGVAPFTYAWTVNGAAQAETGNVLVFNPPNAGTYTIGVTVTDAAGAKASGSSVLTVTATSTAGSANPYSGTDWLLLALIAGVLIGLLIARFLTRRTRPEMVEPSKVLSTGSSGSADDKDDEEDEDTQAPTPAPGGGDSDAVPPPATEAPSAPAPETPAKPG